MSVEDLRSWYSSTCQRYRTGCEGKKNINGYEKE